MKMHGRQVVPDAAGRSHDVALQHAVQSNSNSFAFFERSEALMSFPPTFSYACLAANSKNACRSCA